MKVFYYAGRALGNWNDRHNARGFHREVDRPRRWRVLDRIAGWLYVR